MDPQRMTVDIGMLHHAVTPLWENKSKAELAQWFSDNGFARAYGSNPANWSGLINPFTGQRSYSQTHAVGQRVTSATPDATQSERDAGYRVFYIVANPTQVITWHAGDWTVNRRSIAIENLGDYRNYPLRDGDMRVIADFFRPLDKAVNGALQVLLHNEVYATACPARIAEARNQIVNYINNPPQPPKPQTPVWTGMKVPRAMKAGKNGTKLVNLVTGAVVKSFTPGEKIENLTQRTDWNGTVFVRTWHSESNKIDNGFDFYSLEELPTVVTKEETTTEPVAFTTKKVDDNTLPVGETKVVQQGVKGVRTIVYTVTYTDGVETARTVKSNTVTTQPVEEIIAVGTYVKPTVPEAPTPGDGENAASWLSKVWEWVKQVLTMFTFKK